MSTESGRPFVVAVVAVGLIIAGCNGEPATPEVNDSRSPSAAATSPTPSGGSPAAASTGSRSGATAIHGTTITSRASEFGPMLVDSTGQAIYLFDTETTGQPECYGACAKAWPPVLTSAAPQATRAARAQHLSSTERTDGTTQVTYAGHPLYYYAHEGPGQVLCHNVREFGGLWLVVTPEGGPAS